MSLISASMKDLISNYPADVDPAGLADQIGGNLGDRIKKEDWETCCVRLSRTLNLTALPVSNFGKMKNYYIAGPDKKVPGKIRAHQGGDNKWYIASCYDMHEYLRQKYFPPKLLGNIAQSEMPNTPGIIMFRWRHVDLWDGKTCARLNLFGGSTKAVEFWETKE
jgi:hypothetical protein